MAQLSDAERLEVEEAIRRELPGWKLSNARPTQKKPASGVADGLSVKRVGDFEQLRKKFLGKRSGTTSGVTDSGNKSTGGQFAAPRGRVKTVLLEPVGGGTPKVADVVNGHVTIVQG
jgi:hypothetical protein